MVGRHGRSTISKAGPGCDQDEPEPVRIGALCPTHAHSGANAYSYTGAYTHAYANAGAYTHTDPCASTAAEGHVSWGPATYRRL